MAVQPFMALLYLLNNIEGILFFPKHYENEIL